jgi:hypothetical protein
MNFPFILLTFFPAFYAIDSPCAGKQNVKSVPAGCLTVSGSLVASNLDDTNLRVMHISRLDLPSASLTSSQNSKAVDTDNLALEVSHNLLLKQIAFPDLTDINGDVYMFDNTILQEVLFPQLKSFNGRFLMTANSQVLDKVADPSKNVTNSTQGPGPLLSAPKLASAAGNISLFDVGLISLPLLAEVNGDLRIQQAQLIQLTFPALTKMAGTGTIAIRNNSLLELIQFPSLTSLSGSLIILGNKKWSGFGEQDARNLERVGGSIWISIANSQRVKDGSFLEFKKLRNVRGSMTVEFQGLENHHQTCVELEQKFKKSGIVEGKFQCGQEGQVVTPNKATKYMRRYSLGMAIFVVLIWSL